MADKRMKPDAKHRKKECTCIFCNSKCPDCGSTEVEVDVVTHYRYTNDTRNELDIQMNEIRVQITCEACGRTEEMQKKLPEGCKDLVEKFGGSVLIPKIFTDDDERLKNLRRGIIDAVFPSGYGVTIDDDGNIKTEPYIIRSRTVET